MNFNYLRKEEIEKSETISKKRYEIRCLFCEILLELEKIGHKKVNCRIENKVKEILDKKGVKYSQVFYQNLDSHYGDCTSYDRSLIFNFPNYDRACFIEIMYGNSNGEIKGGYYDNLFEINNLRKEEIEKAEKERQNQYKFTYEKIEEYNDTIDKLREMQEKMGYLGY